MKKIFAMVIIVLLIAANSWAVIVTGSGITKEEAINSGLREAVEMYTGSLVYGVTDVENYQVQKDQIVAASLGYVKKYRIIKTSKIDDLILVTLDVKLSEDKIVSVLRDNVQLVTYEDVLTDYNNVTQRQDQIKKLTEMVRILASRPVHEKYGVVYEGYKIKHIGATKVDVILNVRVTENPFYSRVYNEILKNLSENEKSNETYTIGGKYRIEFGRLVNSKYYIPEDVKISHIDGVKAQIMVDGEPVDKCREYRDNLIVVYDSMVFAKGLLTLFPKVFKQVWNDEKVNIDNKWENAAIKKSKIIPAEGFPLKIKYTIKNSEDIKKLKDLKLTMDKCVAR